MKISNMKIGTQLTLGLGIILVFVLILGLLAWRATDMLWIKTRDFYEHPYQIRRTIGKLEGEIEAMSRRMRDLFIARDSGDFSFSIQEIDIIKRDVERHLAVLYAYYLGPREDVSMLEREFIQWNAIREETIRLIVSGQKEEALNRVRQGGVQDYQGSVVRSCLKTIDTFAMNKGMQLFGESTELNSSINRKLALIMGVITALSLTIIWLLLKGIRAPLRHLTTAADQLRMGNISIRSGYISSNEFGVLSTAFNAMAERVERDMNLNSGSVYLSDVMLREGELRPFCSELLKALTEHTGSQVGAVYLLDSVKKRFDLFESIGLDLTIAKTSFSSTSAEGEFGSALVNGRMHILSDIPEDTQFAFSAVSGKFRPKSIITIPVSGTEGTVAIISIASMYGYDEDVVKLLERILGTMTARMNGVLIYRRTQELAERLQYQNQELEAQKRELAAQTDELTEMNTELEMQKKQLGEASRLKSVFLSTMSHELRTPLNSVIVLSGVLSRRLSEKIPEEELSYLEVIERNGKNLLSIINDILDLSRIEAGREEVTPSQFSIKNIIDDIITSIKPQAEEKRISLVNRSSEDLPSIVSDPEKCRHIIQNLVANAVKFTEKGGVEVSASHIDDEIFISVKDTGIGIPENQLSTIFEEFRQADDSSSRKYGGSGLGLAIAGKYADLLQGEITVKSSPGIGSTFTFRLPVEIYLPGAGIAGSVDSVPEKRFVSEERAGFPTFSGNGHTILIVDDSEPAVIQMTDILSDQGYEIKVAGSGQEALQLIEVSPPDAVVLDIMMPEMDGFEVLAKIRSSDRSMHLPVLMLTAKHVTKEELSFLKGNNIHQLIQKGDVGRGELLDAVAKMFMPHKNSGISSDTKSPLSTFRRKKADRTIKRKERGEKILVLVVEDNPDNMRTARALLQEDFTLIEAMDGEKGVKMATEQMPDVILMDLALPVMDGFAALEAIRDNDATAHIPVLAVTASAMKGDREEILAHGFDGYVSKPIDVDFLKRMIDEVLDD